MFMYATECPIVVNLQLYTLDFLIGNYNFVVGLCTLLCCSSHKSGPISLVTFSNKSHEIAGSEATF